MPFGAEVVADGVRFRLWAPNSASIDLKLDGSGTVRRMTASTTGWHELHVPAVGPGTRYRFILPDGTAVPDPASRWQPEDVHGPSEVVDPLSYPWSDGAWKGRPWNEHVLYELHIGAFTEEGTFQAAIGRLEDLQQLGVTAIELMPVADFPGRWNWGYDGTLPFAPDSAYGRPEDLKALIDAAHAREIAVILDVVYNHLGPDGNYLPLYSPIFTATHSTPWGTAINYDADGSPVVRRMVAENAAYWIEEYNLDGLRLDAVHAIVDDSQPHILEDVVRAVGEVASDRAVHLILENEENEASRLRRNDAGRPIQFTAQWNDDVHHVLHTAATGEGSGYYGDYRGDTERLGRALAEGFAFQGELMRYRGRPRGEPSGDLPPTAFVAFIQNHDQVGNRAFGDRLSPGAPMRAIAAIYLLAPQIPMIFMGEEWAAAEPFPFFSDLGPALAAGVREGRRAEFARFPEFQDPAQQERIPDPTAAETFLAAKLNRRNAGQGTQAEWRDRYRRMLAVRHTEIVPRLGGARCGTYEILGHLAVRVRWPLDGDAELVLLTNLKADPVSGIAPVEGRILWSEGVVEANSLGAWSVVWMLRDAE